MWAFGEQAVWQLYSSEVGAGCEATRFLSDRLQALLKPVFYKPKMYFGHEHINFSVFPFL